MMGQQRRESTIAVGPKSSHFCRDADPNFYSISNLRRSPFNTPFTRFQEENHA
jgi:hypothetical protein